MLVWWGLCIEEDDMDGELSNAIDVVRSFVVESGTQEQRRAYGGCFISFMNNWFRE